MSCGGVAVWEDAAFTRSLETKSLPRISRQSRESRSMDMSGAPQKLQVRPILRAEFHKAWDRQ